VISCVDCGWEVEGISGQYGSLPARYDNNRTARVKDDRRAAVEADTLESDSESSSWTTWEYGNGRCPSSESQLVMLPAQLGASEKPEGR